MRSEPARRGAARPRVSYAEPSSDDSDIIDEADQPVNPATSALRPRPRKSISYIDPSTDDSGDEPERPSRGSTRASKRILELYHSPLVPPSSDPEPSRKRRRTDAGKSSSSSAAKSSHRMPTRRRLANARPRRKAGDGQSPRKEKNTAKKLLAPPELQVPTDGKIPDWQSLPYEILRLVFDYASQPLREALRASPSRSWLVSMATLCRAFREPALAALYECPPVVAPLELHQLLNLLRQDQATTSINYVSKVRRLEIDAATLSYSAHGLGVASLSDLICACPRLRGVYVSDVSDPPPFRPLARPMRPVEVGELLPRLCVNNVRLRGWRWNGNWLACPDPTLMATGLMKEAHQSTAFETIEHLEISHVALENTRISPKKNQTFEFVGLPACLAPLRNLRSLSLESCATESWDFLTMLPRGIRHLRITNNGWLHSTHIEQFLETHGTELESLDLSHNQYLDLHFLPRLGELCPCLQSIKMDTTYYNSVALVKDSDPLYDELLTADMVPTWPRTLRSIEFTNLRKWQQPAAEAFLGSLQESAANLPNLRRVVVKAILSISWRDRAMFRDRFLHSMQRVFKRKPVPPATHLASFRTYREHTRLKSGPPNRMLPRLDAPQADTADSAPRRARPQRRARRAAVRELSSEEPSDEEQSEGGPSEGEPNGGGPSLDGERLALAVQGLCTVVDVNADNHRPLEVQFNEADFIDSEQSGDEDWHEGIDETPRTPEYAW